MSRRRCGVGRHPAPANPDKPRRVYGSYRYPHLPKRRCSYRSSYRIHHQTAQNPTAHTTCTDVDSRNPGTIVCPTVRARVFRRVPFLKGPEYAPAIVQTTRYRWIGSQPDYRESEAVDIGPQCERLLPRRARRPPGEHKRVSGKTLSAASQLRWTQPNI